MPVEIFHTALVIATIGLSYIINLPQFSQYSLVIVLIIFIGFFTAKRFIQLKNEAILNALFTTLVVSTLVNTTGGIDSQLFFLNYFLIFSLSILMEPLISIGTTFALVLFYLFTNHYNLTIDQYAPLFSLPFLAPFALYLGELYRKNAINNQQIKDKQFFLALIVRNHINQLKKITGGSFDDKHLQKIKKMTTNMEKILDEYEKKT